MVAQSLYTASHIGELASGTASHLNSDWPSPKPPSQNASSQSAAWERTREEGEGSRSEQTKDGQEQENDVFFLREKSRQERQSEWEAEDDDEDRLLVVDVKEEEDEEDKEDELEGGGWDVEEQSSPQHLRDETQGKKRQREPGWRKKSQQKKEYGKKWIINNLLLVTTSVSVVSLSDIERDYGTDCRRDGQDPLSTFALARLIHQQFPEADKCRRGPRGNQKINYSKLQRRTKALSTPPPVDDATPPALDKEDEEGTPIDSAPSAELQGKGRKPAPAVRRGDGPQDPSTADTGKRDGTLPAAKEAVVKVALQPGPKNEDDREGCQDAANRLVQVVKSFKSQGKLDMLLKTFAHSASCGRTPCNPICLMFRRVRHHVVNARHACHVMRIYCILLKLHVRRCSDNNCGMTACPALRASRQMKRGRDDDVQEEDAPLQEEEEELQHATKRINGRARRPAALTIRMLSPTQSLPDSQPSTPSPLGSPTHILPPSPARIIPEPPLGIGHCLRMPSKDRGA